MENYVSKMLNALTIDLEDWYQGLTSTSQEISRWPDYESRVVSNTERLLGILSRAGTVATFFVLGYVAEQYPNLIRQVAAEGHEIALHSYHHQRIHQLTPDQFKEDVLRGLDALQNAIGERVEGYRAPMFSINGDSMWMLEYLRELGFRYDSSIFPIRNLWYGIPGAPRFPYHPFENSDFVEFPLATYRILGINLPVGGGFYFRALPYEIIRKAIRKLNSQGKPSVLYIHPWEFDLGQHYSHVTPRERVTHYYGRASLERKVLNLLRDFKFVMLSELMDCVN